MATATVELSSTQIEARQAAQAYLDGRLANGTEAKPSKAFTVPEINIAPSFSSSLADRQIVAAQIRDACTNEGFNWAYEEGLDPTGGDGKYTELDGAVDNGNVWPDEEDIPGFYETVKDY